MNKKSISLINKNYGKIKKNKLNIDCKQYIKEANTYICIFTL